MALRGGPDLARLRAHRLVAQLLREPAATPVDAVAHLLALQGQDFPAVQRAIAIRSGATLEAVRAEFDAGRLVRGWPMRGTLFVTTPRDLAALSALTRERMIASAATRRVQLGIDADDIARCRAVAVELLASAPASRAELQEAWQAAGQPTEGQRGYHLIAHLSEEGLIHWGALRGTTQLLELSEGRVELHPDDADRDAALARVAVGYLRGHGPATEADLAWWTKLTKADVRRGLAAAGPLVASLTLAGTEYRVLAEDLDRVPEPAFPPPREVHLVPGFDEYYLGYADRSPVASAAMQAAAVPGNNGVFRALALSAGVAVGAWRRNPRPTTGEPRLHVELVEPVSVPVRRAVDAAVASWPHD